MNSLAPFYALSEYRGIMPNEKLFYALAHYTPSLFARFARFTLTGLANSPKWYLDSLPNYLGESDLAVLKDERIVESFKQMIAESARSSLYGFAQDMVMIAGPWDFDPADIRVPVHVWHGRKNVHVPFTMGERLARLIPNSIPQFLDNEGHFTIYKRGASCWYLPPVRAKKKCRATELKISLQGILSFPRGRRKSPNRSHTSDVIRHIN